MSGSDSLTELVTQWVQHGVMRMNRRQSVLVQLFCNNTDKFLHASLVVGPVTNDLQAVSQVTISVREVWLQLQGCSVRLDSFRDVSRVLQQQCLCLLLLAIEIQTLNWLKYRRCKVCSLFFITISNTVFFRLFVAQYLVCMFSV